MKYPLIMLMGVLWVSLSGCAQHSVFDEQTINNRTALSDKRISVGRVEVNFSDYWSREQRREHTKSDIGKLKARYQDLFERGFREALEKEGWVIDQQASIEAALKIEDLRVVAPDYLGRFATLYAVDEYGSANFHLTFSQGDALVASFSDRKTANTVSPGSLERTNRATNQRKMQQLLGQIVKQASEAITTSAGYP